MEVGKEGATAQFENSYGSIKTKLYILVNLNTVVEIFFFFVWWGFSVWLFFILRAFGQLFYSFTSLSAS